MRRWARRLAVSSNRLCLAGTSKQPGSLLRLMSNAVFFPDIATAVATTAVPLPQVGMLSGGERNRLHLAKTLKQSGH